MTIEEKIDKYLNEAAGKFRFIRQTKADGEQYEVAYAHSSRKKEGIVGLVKKDGSTWSFMQIENPWVSKEKVKERKHKWIKTKHTTKEKAAEELVEN